MLSQGFHREALGVPQALSQSTESHGLRQNPQNGGASSMLYQHHVSSAPRTMATVFNELVLTSCRVQNREDSCKPIGILVATGVGGPTGHSNLIRVRLTDPTDPFFLYHLELLEDDYGRFKKDHQLHVDFHEFPSVFAGMLHEVMEHCALVQGTSLADRGSNAIDHKLLFEVTTNTTAQLFVQELSRFKTTDVLELHMHREGDVGQKKYLAEQFEHFQQTYLETEQQRKDQAIVMERTISELRGSLAQLEASKDDVESKLMMGASQSESRFQRALLERQDEYAAETKRLRQAYDDERTSLQQRLDAVTQSLREVTAAKESEVSALKTRVASLEGTEASLRGQLNVKTIALESQVQECQQLSEQLKQLMEHRSSSQRALSETGLHNVQLTERLTAAERQSKERSEETRVLRQQATNDAETIRVLTDQIKERNVKVAEIDADLKKAHHIIGNQLQSAKQHKEKLAGVVQQLQDARYMLDQQQQKKTELDGVVEQGRLELKRAQEQIAQLKDQLQSSVDVNATLEQDLKLARDAVVHVQRHGAYSLSRHISSISGAPGMAPSADLYRQYATSAAAAGHATSSEHGTARTTPPAAGGNVAGQYSAASASMFSGSGAGPSMATGPSYTSSLYGAPSSSAPSKTSSAFIRNSSQPPQHATDAPTAYF